VRALEVQRPLWTPGKAHGYHPITYGFLVGEVVRRITGRSLGAFFCDEVARPSGLNAWIGLPKEIQPNVATIEIDPARPAETLVQP
jgi:CubicO group peptidase (beta-lactamase class C family)